MRTAIILVLTIGTAFAQQAPKPCDYDERAVQRMKVIREKGLVAQQEVDDAQAALAQCQAHQAELKAAEQARLARTEELRSAVAALDQLAQRQAKSAELNAEEKGDQAKLDELRRRLSDAHPDVQALKAELEALRAREAAAQARRISVTAQSLKQSTGGLQPGLPDRWWKNPSTAQSLGLTADQQKKMDDTFQQYRLKLIDLNATLEKEEVTLEPLVAAGSLDESKITTQIDRVAQARAELEKANGRMLLGIRKQLTPEQWSKVSQMAPQSQK
jgi:Spy/CpxP family protein refolding chaperone